MIAIRGAGGLLFAGAFALMAMAHIFSMNDNVHHQAQRPQGRADNGKRAIYTIVAHLPIEADGRIRYRIKSKTENFERVVTEDQIVGKLDALRFHY
jgi:hypothetical protein